MKGVRLIIVQFSFSNLDAVPEIIQRLEPETQEEQVKRKSHQTGKLLIAPTIGVSLKYLLQDMETRNFELVGAFYKERRHAKPQPGREIYHAVRFTFAHRDFVNIKDKSFIGKRQDVLIEFQRMCTEALWRTRVIDNPFFVEGVEVSGQRTLSINLEVREPFFNLKGRPLYRKGGESIEPSFNLRLQSFENKRRY